MNYRVPKVVSKLPKALGAFSSVVIDSLYLPCIKSRITKNKGFIHGVDS